MVSIDRRSESQITQILHDIGGTTECKDGINFLKIIIDMNILISNGGV